MKFYPEEKGGGDRTNLSHAEAGWVGGDQFWGSFYAEA